MTEETLVDALHLLPHLEIGLAPLAWHLREGHQELVIAQHESVALKPALSLCRFEAHLVAEVVQTGERSTKHEEMGNARYLAGWRLGAELFIRPSRLMSEWFRAFDVIGVGFGVTIGGIAEITYESWHRWHFERPHIEVEPAVEVGPRLLFDVNEWLGFVLAANSHHRLRNSVLLGDSHSEIGFVLSGSIQLSFPSHSVFAHTSH